MGIKEIKGIKVVNDANTALEQLRLGKKIARFEYGDSLSPILNSGEYAILTPINDYDDIKIGDVVFCLVNGILMTHMIWLISESNYQQKQFLIGSSSGQLYGWTTWIYAKAKGTNIFENGEV